MCRTHNWQFETFCFNIRKRKRWWKSSSEYSRGGTLVERALSALRFAPNATLKISPFEAHHGREANAVLGNLTKKPSLQNLN